MLQKKVSSLFLNKLKYLLTVDTSNEKGRVDTLPFEYIFKRLNESINITHKIFG